MWKENSYQNAINYVMLHAIDETNSTFRWKLFVRNCYKNVLRTHRCHSYTLSYRKITKIKAISKIPSPSLRSPSQSSEKIHASLAECLRTSPDPRIPNARGVCPRERTGT